MLGRRRGALCMCSKPEAPAFPSHRARATDATRSLARMAHARPALSDEVADSRPTPLASLAACDRMVRMRWGPAITPSTALAREAHAEPIPWGLIPRVAVPQGEGRSRSTSRWLSSSMHACSQQTWRRVCGGHHELIGGPSGAIRGHPGPSGAIEGHGGPYLGPSRAIRGHPGPSPVAPRGDNKEGAPALTCYESTVAVPPDGRLAAERDVRMAPSNAPLSDESRGALASWA